MFRFYHNNDLRAVAVQYPIFKIQRAQMDRRIIKSFIYRAFFSTLFLLLAGSYGVIHFMEYNYEKSLTSQMGSYIDKVKDKYTQSLKYEISNRKSEMESDARGIMREMEFILLEVYDENHEELLELTSNSKKFEEMLKNIKENHDSLIVHNFPKGDELDYNFFEAEGDAYVQIFYPIINQGVKLGYIEGISYIKPIVVNQFKRGVATTVIAIICSVILLSSVIFPLVYIAYKELKVKQQELLFSNIQIIRSLGNAVAQRDSDTDEHNYRVTLYSIALAESMELPEESMRNLIKGSFLHDVGKIGIRDEILLKPGKLDADEFEIMKTHVSKGGEIIDGIEWLEGAELVIDYHHEKFDGSGYLSGLKGEEIPLEARIFAVVDVFDALTSKRPYKEPFPFEKAIEILKKESGTHFDPDIVKSFCSIIEDLYKDISAKNSKELKSELFMKIDRYFS